MEFVDNLVGFFVGMVWIIIPLLLVIVIIGAIALVVNKNPDMIKRHPEKVRLWRRKGKTGLSHEIRAGRYDKKGQLSYFQIKNLIHIPLLGLNPEHKDDSGYYNLLEYKKGIILPLQFNLETRTVLVPELIPMYNEIKNEQGAVIGIEWVMEDYLDENKEIKKRHKLIPTGNMIELPSVESFKPAIDETSYTMLHLLAAEIPKDKSVITGKNWLDPYIPVISFIAMGALCVLMMIFVLQQGVMPTVNSLTGMQIETTKQIAKTMDSVESVTKSLEVITQQLAIINASPTPTPVPAP
jgi:hypothetical protein